mgnify:CR=1 FL=1
MNPTAAQDLGGDTQVFQATVGAGADDHLVNGHIAGLAHRAGVRWEVRERHLRLDRAHVHLDDPGVGGVGLIDVIGVKGAAIHVGAGCIVHGEEAGPANSMAW